jgi:tetratricopeptide (TPR) repeat protein
MTTKTRALIAVAVICAVLVPVLAVAQGDAEDLSPAQRYFLRGTELMNNRKLLDAAEQFQLAIDEDPDYVDAYRRLAFVYTEMAKSEEDYFQDALDTYEDLEALLPADDVDVRKNKAFVQAAMGDMDDAIDTYEAILEIAPEDCGVWSQIAIAHKTQADRLKADEGDAAEIQARLDEAVNAFREVTQLCPENVDAYNALGELYYGGGKLTEAAGVYAELLEKDPGNVDISSRLGYLYVQAEDWKSAETVYKTLLEADPSRLNDRALYAKSLENQEKFDQAADQYMMLIDDGDASKKAMYCNLIFLYIKAKNWKKAIDTGMKGISENAPQQSCLTAGWAKGLELRGIEQYRGGQYDAANTSYQEAKLKFQTVQGDPSFGDYATKQIQRLNKLIEQNRLQKEKARQEGGS